ncbi:MAG: DUF1905 domain-containing protein [Saprospiraceae bacterium]|nr:DUF1905 domain-containing protein [Saprospiraceae bacterium]
MEQPIIDQHYVVEKRIAQSGFKMNDWTYVVIADFPAERKSRNGNVRVRGWIDMYELQQYNLLPMKDGGMMLPLNAAVRKKIGKRVGDTVHVVLYADESPLEIPDDILVCLMDSPKAYDFFISLSESNQKYYIDWIEAAKKVETKAERILKMIERLENGLKFYDWVREA